ncbi:hypothetical protein SAMN05421663_104176 [Terribacillus halophilus]|uniref:Uncharacterized protein n=1 Tax=Terribacillus halophilus TaxID=361279 RepID=A0A1G6PNV3_9BACI|nr:hypothetical protein [Terribacillus halophilus]SDC81035.1 hypothetical protein SAMN05421663_104176 [Terribacillus halophilus]
MISEAFTELLNEFGVEVYFNDENKPRNVIITSKGINLNEFDDKVIHSDVPLKRGDIVKYGVTYYIVFSDVQSKRVYEYKAVIRPATNTIPIHVQEEQVTDPEYDEYDNPIPGTGEVIPAVIEDVPCIVYQQSFSIIAGQITVAESEINILMADNEKSQKVEINDEYIIQNVTYRISDINLLKTGLRIFIANRV